MGEKELRDEIDAFIKNKFDKDEKYVFISYSHKDSECVYRKVVEWIRAGYNIYIDIDFENHSSEDNWVDQMQKKIQSKGCVKVVCFYSENYIFSYAALLELLTMRSDETRRVRTADENVSIDILQLGNEPKDDGMEFSSREVKTMYKKYFTQMTEREKELFANNKAEEAAFVEGIKSVLREEGREETTPEEEVKLLKLQYRQGLQDYYPKVAEYIARWKKIAGLNGNTKQYNCDETIEFNNKNVYKHQHLGCQGGEEKPLEDTPKKENVSDTSTSETILEKPVENETAQDGENNGVIVDEKEKKKSYSVTGDLKYTLYGEPYTGNQSDMMIMTFGKILKNHPDIIDEALRDFNCLSHIDYMQPANRNDSMLSYFRVCHTFVIDGKTVCVGTAYSMNEKLKKLSEIIAAAGEDVSVLQIEGIELPQLKTRNKVDRKISSGASDNITYYVFGEKKTGNQSDMMYDYFEKLVQRYPEKIANLVSLSSVKAEEDISNVGTKEAVPTYFRGAKRFEAMNKGYYVGTSFGKGAKTVQLRKMMEICGAPQDSFQIEGEEMNAKAKAKKDYEI